MKGLSLPLAGIKYTYLTKDLTFSRKSEHHRSGYKCIMNKNGGASNSMSSLILGSPLTACTERLSQLVKVSLNATASLLCLTYLWINYIYTKCCPLMTCVNQIQ